LVRRLCRECRRPVLRLDPAEERFLGPYASGTTIYEAAGCPVCSYQGFAGRIVVEEVLVMNRELRRLVRDNAAEEQMVEAARRAGFATLKDNAIRRVLAGETTVREAMRVVHGVDELAAAAVPPGAAMA